MTQLGRLRIGRLLCTEWATAVLGPTGYAQCHLQVVVVAGDADELEVFCHPQHLFRGFRTSQRLARWRIRVVSSLT